MGDGLSTVGAQVQYGKGTGGQPVGVATAGWALGVSVLPFTAEGRSHLHWSIPITVRNGMGNDETVGSRPLRLRWIGGASLPTTGGWRVHASEFLAELLLEENWVELRLRGLLPRLTRAETLRAKPTDLSEAFPIRSRISFRGVGFRRPDGREYYFKTGQIDNILRALQDLSFPVSWIDQRASKLWRLEP